MTFLEKHLFPLLLLLTVLILGSVYFIEYVLGHPPCTLCLYQRLPWYFLFIICCFALKLPKLCLPITVLCLLLFSTNAALAGYHTGVEFGWWKGPSTCSSVNSEASFEELKAALLSAPVIRCDEVSFRLFGSSLAFWNFVVSMLSSAVLPVLLIRSKKVG